MNQARYTLCACLRRWPIDRLLLQRPVRRHEPFVLVETARCGQQVVAHVGPGVPAVVRPGMAMAEARAYCAGLLSLPARPDRDARALATLARRLTRLSPHACPAPPDAIFLDATGMELLYGGPAALLRRAADTLAALRVAAGLAVAPTPGAAWALAAFADRDRGPAVALDRDAVLRAAGPLPPEALRLDAPVAAALRSLGVGTVAAVLRLPRNHLVVRFGPDVPRRIDQLTGDAPEPLAWLDHRSPVYAAVEFDGAVADPETVYAAARRLLDEATAELSRRGQGARELRVTLPRPYAPPIERTIALTRPSRSARDLSELVRCSLGSIGDVGGVGDGGFTGVRLDVARAEHLAEEQAEFSGDQGRQVEADLGRLVERLHARFGDCLAWPAITESRRPERAMRCAAAPAGGASRPGRAARPTRLLREPEPVRVAAEPPASFDGRPVSMTRAGRVYRLGVARGPERIAGEWWDGRWKTRDYFDAEDETGRRYWLFRVAETGRWFLHGLFE